MPKLAIRKQPTEADLTAALLRAIDYLKHPAVTSIAFSSSPEVLLSQIDSLLDRVPAAVRNEAAEKITKHGKAIRLAGGHWSVKA